MSPSHRLLQQEQQRLAVGPGNVQFISIRHVSSDAAMLQRGRCGHCRRSARVLLCIGNSMIKN